MIDTISYCFVNKKNDIWNDIIRYLINSTYQEAMHTRAVDRQDVLITFNVYQIYMNLDGYINLLNIRCYSKDGLDCRQFVRYVIYGRPIPYMNNGIYFANPLFLSKSRTYTDYLISLSLKEKCMFNKIVKMFCLIVLRYLGNYYRNWGIRCPLSSDILSDTFYCIYIYMYINVICTISDVLE